MGVTGLWKLIEPCGEVVPVDTLEGKVLSIDISIWLHQVVKGFQDNKGSALSHAHLLGLFHRLCKLLYYRVRPVFVFDGCVPQLKRDTIARRQMQRSKLNTEADRIQTLLLQSLAKEKVVQHALGINAELLFKSPTKRTSKRTDNDKDEMFKLPELPKGNAIKAAAEHNAEESDQNDTSYTTDDYDETSMSTEDSSFEESNTRSSYCANLQAIDVRSKHFRDLPADVRHEILVDIKETQKQNSWGRLHELPSRSDDFCSFQMKRLLKRRAVQESIETAEQEMGGRSLTYAELQQLFTEEGILEPSAVQAGTKQISSDEHTRFLLVRDLKKKFNKIKEEQEAEEKNVKNELSAETIKEEVKPEIKISPTVSEQKVGEHDGVKEESKVAADLGNEYEADLQLAIALSMEDEDTTHVYDDKDYEYDSAESLKLNRDQRKQLQNAAVGPARTYMIEYAGMNSDEVVGIMDKTQVADNNDDDDKEFLHNSKHILTGNDTKADEKNKADENTILIESSEELLLKVSDDDDDDDDDDNKTVSDLEPLEYAGENDNNKASKEEEIGEELHLLVSDKSDTDSDLEEVIEKEYDNKTKTMQLQKKKSLEIVVDLKEPLAQEDDLFADVFELPMAVTAKEQQINIKETKSTEDNKNVTKPAKNTAHMLDIIKELQQQAADVKKITLEQQTKENTTDSIIVLSEEQETLQQIPSSSKNMLSILDELKQQADSIKNINLDDIKLSNSIIEISDEENSQKLQSSLKHEAAAVKAEVIEICDSDDGVAMKALHVTPCNSPNTPNKGKAITEYFETNYFIKRTPDKPKKQEEADAQLPKVKSPFFVKKDRTPNSGRKRAADHADSPTHANKVSKAAKTLFDNEQQTSTNETGIAPIIEEPPMSAEQALHTAAEMLKEQKSASELETLASDLVKERANLENERNRQDRMGMSISQRMNSECQELLRLFGIPYIIAPMEAEAQCAFLDAVELTQGTITDDSDIWLFGGRTVYKNFFAQNKHVLKFCADKIEKSFNCDRKKLIQLACLVGSDYTTGVHGIGAVTALEILAAFSLQTKEALAHESNSNQTVANVIITLSKFRDWWLAHKSSTTAPGSSAQLALRKKLKNIELHEGFPSMQVVEAYLTPKVDDNKEAFSWGQPDVESLRDFARKTFGWTTSKTDDILMPVMKKINEKKSQATIRNYFSVKSALSVRELKVSKRVQNAIDKMSGKIPLETPEKPARATRKRTAAKRKESNATNDIEENEAHLADAAAELEPSTSKSVAKMPKRKINLPNLKQIIPQRENDIKQMAENKKKAAEVLKKTAAKKKRNQ